MLTVQRFESMEKTSTTGAFPPQTPALLATASQTAWVPPTRGEKALHCRHFNYSCWPSGSGGLRLLLAMLLSSETYILARGVQQLARCPRSALSPVFLPTLPTTLRAFSSTHAFRRRPLWLELAGSWCLRSHMASTAAHTRIIQPQRPVRDR